MDGCMATSPVVNRCFARGTCGQYVLGGLGVLGGVGGVWEGGEVGGDSSLEESVLTTLNQSKNPQAQALLMEYRCVFSFNAYRGSRDIPAFASVYLSPMLCSCGGSDNAGVWRSSPTIWRGKLLDTPLQRAVPECLEKLELPVL